MGLQSKLATKTSGPEPNGGARADAGAKNNGAPANAGGRPKKRNQGRRGRGNGGGPRRVRLPKGGKKGVQAGKGRGGENPAPGGGGGGIASGPTNRAKTRGGWGRQGPSRQGERSGAGQTNRGRNLPPAGKSSPPKHPKKRKAQNHLGKPQPGKTRNSRRGPTRKTWSTGPAPTSHIGNSVS